MNVLNFSIGNNINVNGGIMINGAIADATKMSMVTSYVPQDDLFFGTLTVNEHLEFCVIL